MYFEQNLVTQVKLGSNRITNDGDLYIGGYHHRIAFPVAGLDNIQIFNKALTLDEITILALANKDAMQD